MADAVLDFLTQLGETLVVAFRYEDRVVAETFGAVLFGSDRTVYDAVKLMDFLDVRTKAIISPLSLQARCSLNP